MTRIPRVSEARAVRLAAQKMLDTGNEGSEMCGRLDVHGETLNSAVSQELGLPFKVATNRALKPTQVVSTISLVNGVPQQLDTTWGIKPRWADRIIINAKSESVTLKQTFTKAFAEHRCLVPCTGFYEWQPGLSGKRKLRFFHKDGLPLYMGAFWYPGDTPQLVTLTRAAPEPLRAIHHRFPVFIDPSHARRWLTRPSLEILPLMQELGGDLVNLEPAAPDPAPRQKPLV